MVVVVAEGVALAVDQDALRPSTQSQSECHTHSTFTFRTHFDLTVTISNRVTSSLKKEASYLLLLGSIPMTTTIIIMDLGHARVVFTF
jgi:hypothetical protein